MVKNTKTIARLLIALAILALMFWPALSIGRAEQPATSKSELCAKGKSLNIVAHQDDDLLFLNPDIQKDIAQGKCVTTVYVTIGDYGHNQGLKFAENRESGDRAAYAEMAGQPDSWRQTTISINSRRLSESVLRGNNKIKLIFMRLPNTGGRLKGWKYYGYQSLEQLYLGYITEVTAADRSASYDLNQLVDTLAQIINNFHPSVVRTQDFTRGFNTGDHDDHVVVALLVYEANRSAKYTHSLISYEQYGISQRLENLSLKQRLAKEKTWLKYVPYDTDVCQTLEICSRPQKPYYNYYSWLGREYKTDVIYTERPSNSQDASYLHLAF